MSTTVDLNPANLGDRIPPQFPHASTGGKKENTAAKAGIAYTVGSPELRRIIVRAFAVIVVLGVISGGLVLLLW